MFKKLTPLDAKKHGNLKLIPVSDYAFARGELVAPIVIDELANVAREYPIVFPNGKPFPVALLGVAKGCNAYVGPDGQWLASYIPASIRHYPMTIRRLPAAAPQSADASETEKADGKTQAQERFVVLLDTASPFVSETQGEPMFDENGQPGDLAQKKIKILNMMQSRASLTRRQVRAIEAAGLLTERVIKVKTAGAADQTVKGIRVIDEAALNKLDDAAFSRLRAAGALPLVYAAMLSWANFRQGLIVKSMPLPAASAEMGGDVIPLA